MQRRSKLCCQAIQAIRPITAPISIAHIAAFDSLLLTDQQGVSCASMDSFAASSRTNDGSEPRVALRCLNVRYKGWRSVCVCMYSCDLCATRGRGERTMEERACP